MKGWALLWILSVKQSPQACFCWVLYWHLLLCCSSAQPDALGYGPFYGPSAVPGLGPQLPPLDVESGMMIIICMPAAGNHHRQIHRCPIQLLLQACPRRLPGCDGCTKSHGTLSRFSAQGRRLQPVHAAARGYCWARVQQVLLLLVSRRLHSLLSVKHTRCKRGISCMYT